MKEIFYDWFGLNVWLFHFINNIRSEFIDTVMLLGTSLGSYKLIGYYLAILVVAIFIILARKYKHSLSKKEIVFWLTPIIVLIVSYLFDGLFLKILKPLLDFPRPPLALPLGSVNIVSIAEYHNSFPSGHSSFAMLIVASLWPLLVGWQRYIGVLFVVWVGISRISVGAHFPADVLGGFITSFIIVMLVRKGLTIVQTKIIKEDDEIIANAK